MPINCPIKHSFSHFFGSRALPIRSVLFLVIVLMSFSHIGCNGGGGALGGVVGALGLPSSTSVPSDAEIKAAIGGGGSGDSHSVVVDDCDGSLPSSGESSTKNATELLAIKRAEVNARNAKQLDLLEFSSTPNVTFYGVDTNQVGFNSVDDMIDFVFGYPVPPTEEQIEANRLRKEAKAREKAEEAQRDAEWDARRRASRVSSSSVDLESGGDIEAFSDEYISEEDLAFIANGGGGDGDSSADAEAAATAAAAAAEAEAEQEIFHGPHKKVDLYDSERGFYGTIHARWSGLDATVESATHPLITEAARAAEMRATKEFLFTRLEARHKHIVLNRKKTTTKPNADKEKGAKEDAGGAVRALDAGCGVGRTAELLLGKQNYYDTIDLIEPQPHFMAKAMEAVGRLGDVDAKKGGGNPKKKKNSLAKAKGPTVATKLGATYNTSLELVDLPLVPTYDLVYIQWVAMYLTDNDLIDFLKKCRQSLRNGTLTRPRTLSLRERKRRYDEEEALGNDDFMLSDAELQRRKKVDLETVSTTGVIFIKENIVPKESFFMVNNHVDIAFNRCDKHYRAIFKAAGLTVIDYALDENWQKGLLPLGMYALM